MEIKKEVFGRLDKIAKPGAILASNTSYLNIDEIAASTSRPQDVVGLHFFSPANVMKLLEIVRGAKTAPDVLVTAMQLAKKIKKVAVVAGVCHGFIGNRMLMPRQVEATKLLLEGATPEQIDRVHVEFGMPMGPFQMADLAGVDIGWHRDPNRIENIRDALCAIDRWGQKKGAGFYDYDDKRRPSPSPVVQQIIEDFAAKQGVTRREIDDEEIVERTLYTMVNEGAKILEEGMAQRASDIDVVWVYGYGWPVYRGGPMFWADTEGLDKIVDGPEESGSADGERLQLQSVAARQGGQGREVHPLTAFQPEGKTMNDYMVEESTGLRAVRYRAIVVWIHWITALLVVTQVVYRLHLPSPAARGTPERMDAVRLAQDGRRADPGPRAGPACRAADEPAAALSVRLSRMGAVLRGLEPPAVLCPADRLAAHRPGSGVGPGRGWDGAAAVRPGVARPFRGSPKKMSFGEVHEILVWTTLALVVLHIGAALNNQFVVADRCRRPDAAVQARPARLASAPGISHSIAPASAATPAATVKVSAGPPRSHSRPAPRLASSAAIPLAKKKAPKLVAR